MLPRFLTIDVLLALHADLIARYGGDPGVRDRGLLESAAAQPMAMFGGLFLHEDMAAKAGAYLFHLAMNHPFVDGNKRVAVSAAIVFLDLNDQDLLATPDELEQFTLAVARSERTKKQVIKFFQAQVKPRSAS